MIVFDELAFAEKMNKKGFVKCFSIYELSIYAKWLYSLNKSKEEIEKELIEFSKKWNKDFVYDVDYRKIDRALSSINDYSLRTTTPTIITVNEWEKVLSLDDERYRKVLFIMLVISKYYKTNNTKIESVKEDNKYKDTYFCNFSDVEILKLAGVRFNDCSLRDKMFNQLYINKLIDITHGKKSIRIITCVDNSGDIKETVTDYDNIILHYERHIGEKIGECKECGKLFRQSKQNNTEYCNKHKGYSPIETKIIKCIEPDCGKEFKVDSKDNKTCRCEKCTKIHRNNYQKELMKKRRDKDSI